MTTDKRSEDFRRAFRYEAWANARMQEFLAANAPPHEAISVWSHLIVTKQMWLARVNDEDYNRLQLWSIHPIAEAGTLLGEAERRWQGFLDELDDAELDRVVTFHNTKGVPQADALADILRHVVLHGTYHRGQIATLVKAAGAEVPVTDFIAFAREEHAPPAESKKLASTKASGRQSAKVSDRRKSV
jgi:uncharacterized damage-inducible protein DinB